VDTDTTDRRQRITRRQSQLHQIDKFIKKLDRVLDVANTRQARVIDAVCDGLSELYQELEKELKTI
jgi:ferritin-like metal-binding protein YciE